MNPKYGTPLFNIGNGATTPKYEMKAVILEKIGMTENDLVKHNTKHKENPLGEDLYYSSETFSFANLILSEADIPINSSGKPYAYKRTCITRNNAFTITSNGRAILERGTTTVSIEDLKDNDILVKSEIETLIATKISEALSNRS